MIALWDRYWAWVGGNVGAMPLQAVITVIATLLLGRPLRWLWHRVFGERADMQDLKRMAEAAERRAATAARIAADLFEHHTGEAHPEAPAKPESEAR